MHPDLWAGASAADSGQHGQPCVGARAAHRDQGVHGQQQLSLVVGGGLDAVHCAAQRAGQEARSARGGGRCGPSHIIFRRHCQLLHLNTKRARAVGCRAGWDGLRTDQGSQQLRCSCAEGVRTRCDLSLFACPHSTCATAREPAPVSPPPHLFQGAEQLLDVGQLDCGLVDTHGGLSRLSSGSCLLRHLSSQHICKHRLLVHVSNCLGLGLAAGHRHLHRQVKGGLGGGAEEGGGGGALLLHSGGRKVCERSPLAVQVVAAGKGRLQLLNLLQSGIRHCLLGEAAMAV